MALQEIRRSVNVPTRFPRNSTVYMSAISSTRSPRRLRKTPGATQIHHQLERPDGKCSRQLSVSTSERRTERILRLHLSSCRVSEARTQFIIMARKWNGSYHRHGYICRFENSISWIELLLTLINPEHFGARRFERDLLRPKYQKRRKLIL